MDRPSAVHKAILSSLLVASMILPIRAARHRKLRVAMQELLLGLGLFCVVYLIATLLTAPH